MEEITQVHRAIATRRVSPEIHSNERHHDHGLNPDPDE